MVDDDRSPDESAPDPTVDLGRRGFLGKLAWATSGALIGSAAALETVSAAADPSGPTGPEVGTGFELPSTGSGSALGSIAAALVAAGGAAVYVARRGQNGGETAAP